MSKTDQHGNEMVYARPKKVIKLHWFNAISWLILTISGLGIVRGDYRFMPYGFAEWMQNMVGGQFTLITSHSILGLIWMFVFIVFTFKNFNDVVLPFLKKVLSITPTAIIEDSKYMVVAIAQLLGLLKNVKLPPEGRYNGAQKLLGTMIIFSSVMIALTGVAMFVMFIFTELMINSLVFRWSLVFHGFFVGLVWFGLVSHLYYSLIEAPKSLEGMKSGYLEKDFVKHHSPAWYDELKRKGEIS